MSSLISAVILDNFGRLQDLINSGANIDDCHPISGWTALMVACMQADRKESLKFVQLLLQNGANVNFNSAVEKYSPLYLACNSSNTEIVKSLCESGADVNHPATDKKYTPVCVSAGLGNLEVVKYLSEKGADMCYISPVNQYNALLAASIGGHCETIEFLLQQGASSIIDKQVVNVETGETEFEEGDTPLHVAVRKDAVDVVKVLCTAGANSSIQNKASKTPYQLAKDLKASCLIHLENA